MVRVRKQFISLNIFTHFGSNYANLDMEPKFRHGAQLPLPPAGKWKHPVVSQESSAPSAAQWAVCGQVGFATSFAAKATTLQYEGMLGQILRQHEDPGAAHPRTPVAGAATSLQTIEKTRQVCGLVGRPSSNPGSFLPFLILASGTMTHSGTNVNHRMLSSSSSTSKFDSSSN